MGAGEFFRCKLYSHSSEYFKASELELDLWTYGLAIIDCYFAKDKVPEDVKKRAEEFIWQEWRDVNRTRHFDSFTDLINASKNLGAILESTDSPAGLILAEQAKKLRIPFLVTAHQTGLADLIKGYCERKSYPLFYSGEQREEKSKPEYWQRVYDKLMKQMEKGRGRK